MTSMHYAPPKSGPWLLQASRHVAYDIQSPAPGAPMQTKRGPAKPSLDPTSDPMGNLNTRPYNYDGMVNNLVSHYHGANDGEKKSGRLWYKAAHDLFHNFSKDNNITPERSVAYGAAFSPLTDWGDNVHHAQKFMLGYTPDKPGFSKHDWQQAHIHPAALDAFQQQNGRAPSDSDEDLHALADLHAPHFSRGPSKNATNDLSDPNARQEWMDNIQHKGMDATLADHAQQRIAHEKSVKGRKGEPFNPSMAMRASGISTLGGNIQKAKDLYHSPEDVAQMFKVLGGPKISHFTDNILDDTPINSEGYYAHPNGDWQQNKDLGGTVDSHHMRAASMPHGAWERKPYAVSNPSTDHEYDVYNRGLFDATKRINEGIGDPGKHITPKQLQAIVWLKHKNDKDYFERQRNPQTGGLINNQHELGGADRPEDWQFAEKSYKSKGKGLGKGPSPRAAALEPADFQNMPQLWRKVFMGRQPEEWTDLLDSYVAHNSPGPAQPDGSFETPDPLEQHEQERMGPDPMHTGQLKSGPWLLEASGGWYIATSRDGDPWFVTGADAMGDLDDNNMATDKRKGTGGSTDAQAIGDAGGTSAGDAQPMAMPSMAPSGGGAASGGAGIGSPVSAPGSGTERWRSEVDTGLQRNGLPTSLDNQVLHQMDTESSGNPNAINNWDSNAKAGHPSQGLMQEIPTTFEQHRLPMDADNINDPQANIDSAIGYAKGTYGPSLLNSQGNGMGSGHGY